LGCSAVVVDLYGEAFPPALRESRANVAKAFDMMNELLADPIYTRQLLRTYIDEAIKQLNGDPTKVGAVGFCFGGACAIEMIRDGAPLKAAVSIHGTLDAKPLKPLTGKPTPTMKTSPPPPNHTKGSHVLVCTGAADPLVPPKMLQDFQDEIDKTKAVATCTVASYTGVLHGFTTPNLTPLNGMGFDANAARRAWVACFDLFSQAFDVPLIRPVPAELWVNREIVARL
jgi:dienelactone hydrolase